MYVRTLIWSASGGHLTGISLHSVWRGFTLRKERLVGLIVSVFVSAVMGLVSAILVTTTNPDSLKAHSSALIYASNIVLSVILGIVIALIIPFGKIGASLARKAGATPPSSCPLYCDTVAASLPSSCPCIARRSLVPLICFYHFLSLPHFLPSPA